MRFRLLFVPKSKRKYRYFDIYTDQLIGKSRHIGERYQSRGDVTRMRHELRVRRIFRHVGIPFGSSLPRRYYIDAPAIKLILFLRRRGISPFSFAASPQLKRAPFRALALARPAAQLDMHFNYKRGRITSQDCSAIKRARGNCRGYAPSAPSALSTSVASPSPSPFFSRKIVLIVSRVRLSPLPLAALLCSFQAYAYGAPENEKKISPDSPLLVPLPPPASLSLSLCLSRHPGNFLPRGRRYDNDVPYVINRRHSSVSPQVCVCTYARRWRNARRPCTRPAGSRHATSFIHLTSLLIRFFRFAEDCGLASATTVHMHT